MKINRHYLKLEENYLFTQIAKRTAAFQKKHPTQKLIKLSIGDVTRPLPQTVITALQNAVNEMGQADTFHGYGPETGYPWLKQAIKDYYQQQKSVTLATNEIIISDGAKSDIANLLDILDPCCRVVMIDPGYPVYYESNMMCGRRPRFCRANTTNNFLPLPSHNLRADVIYLCNPANPTGVVYNRQQLQDWVDFARKHHALIIYDAAYEAFITDQTIPSSIYQIAGAKECAIEICSLSKTAGFTGLRCGYTIVPNALCYRHVKLNQLWQRRQTTKFNGVSYVVQRGAETVFSKTGWAEVQKNLQYYHRNVACLRETLDALQWKYVGGVHSPYLWVRCPQGFTAWQFFDYLLTRCGIVCTPGSGFGKGGEHYIRLTGFNSYTATQAACKRLRKLRL